MVEMKPLSGMAEFGTCSCHYDVNGCQWIATGGSKRIKLVFAAVVQYVVFSCEVIGLVASQMQRFAMASHCRVVGQQRHKRDSTGSAGR